VRRILAVLALAAAQSGFAAERFSFAAVGDIPYFAFEVPAVAQLLDALPARDVAFVVHVGDIKHGSTPCSDEMLETQRRLVDASPLPLVYTPGDNEWTDCHRGAAGSYDPIERLTKLRALFFPDSESLGRQRFAVARQSDDPRFAEYRENARWTHGGVVFVTLNVPGSNNNLGRNPEQDAEHHRRMRANLAWLEAAVKAAQSPGVLGLVVVAHADPRFDRATRGNDGYARYREALRGHAERLRKPMLLVHGDGHRYRVDQPLKGRDGVLLANFTRLETFGAPGVAWVRVEVDPANPRLFSIAPGIQPPPGP
jgi:hypothetical protein